MWTLAIYGIGILIPGFYGIYLAIRYSIAENIDLNFLAIDRNLQYPGTYLLVHIPLLLGLLVIMCGITCALEGITMFKMKQKKDSELVEFIDKWWNYRRILMFSIMTLAAIYFIIGIFISLCG